MIRLTGMSRSGVFEGLHLALERGTLLRRESGNSFLYAVRLPTPYQEGQSYRNPDVQNSDVQNVDGPQMGTERVQNSVRSHPQNRTGIQTYKRKYF